MADDTYALKPRSRTETKQDYRTPPEFVRAVEWRYGQIVLDLAAKDGDEVKPLLEHITPEQDSLKVPWPTRRHASGVYFLNPPFRDPLPWARKAAEWRATAAPGVVLAFLILASVDTLWWRTYVRDHAIARTVNRIKFLGADETYPKPLALLLYDPRYSSTGNALDFWDWRVDLKLAEAAR